MVEFSLFAYTYNTQNNKITKKMTYFPNPDNNTIMNNHLKVHIYPNSGYNQCILR